MPTFECDAIIFDQDGILIDSETTNELHWRQWADEKGVSAEHILSVHHGRPVIQTIGIVAPHLDAAVEAVAFEGVLANHMDTLQPYPGAHRLLTSLPAGRWAVATSAPRIMAVPRLEHLGLPVPEIVVTINDVANGKPAPDPYLMAAERLGFAPERCVVIEDAPAGVTSARAAGANVIAVASTNPAEALQEADAVVGRLVDIDVVIQEDRLIIHL